MTFGAPSVATTIQVRRTFAPAVWALAWMPALVLVAAAGSTGCAHRGSSSGQSQSADSLSTWEMTPAEAEFANGAKRAPTPKTLYSLSQLLASQGKQEQSEYILRKIIAEYPKFMPAYCDLAESQMRQRHIEEAVRTLSAGLKITPGDAILANDRGMCYMLLRDYGKALEDFTKATAIAPDNARYRSNMAAAVGMLGRYEESLALYKQVMPVADAHHNLAVLCDARGDHKRAELENRLANPNAGHTSPTAQAAAPAPARSVETPTATASARSQREANSAGPVVVTEPIVVPPPVTIVEIPLSQPAVAPAIAPEENETLSDRPELGVDEDGADDATNAADQADDVQASTPQTSDSMVQQQAQLAAAQVTPAESDEDEALTDDASDQADSMDAVPVQPTASSPTTNQSESKPTDANDTDGPSSERTPDSSAP